jgi:hypothetical protein
MPDPKPPATVSLAQVFADPARLRERLKLAIALAPPLARRRRRK